MIKSSLTPPIVDQATVDHYVAKGRRERSKALAEFFRAIFPSREARQTPLRRKIRTKVSTA